MGPQTVEPPRRLRRFILRLAAAVYIAAATAVSVVIVSFTPNVCEPLTQYIPANAAIVFHAANSRELLRELEKNEAFKALLDDPDAESVWKFSSRKDRLRSQIERVPAFVKSFVPLTRQGLDPVAGNEVAAVVTAGEKREANLVVFTRVSGSPGQLARMAAHFAPYFRKKDPQLFDLGGDLIAASFGGGAVPAATNATSADASNPLPLARLRINLSELPRKTVQEVSLRQDAILQMQFEGVPPEVTDAIQTPPRIEEMLRLREMKGVLDIGFYRSATGEFFAHGTLTGNLPPIPESAARPETKGSLFAEALLPVNFRALFLRYMASTMRFSKNMPVGLTRSQRNWVRRFGLLEDANVDLDRDLFPAFGNVVHVSVREPEIEPTATGHGLVEIRTPFTGTNASRRAAGELSRVRWDYMFDTAAPRSIRPPYVRRFRSLNNDRYVLVNGQVIAPSWTVTQDEVRAVSDAGVFALLEKPEALPRPAKAAGDKFQSYFVRIDGEKLASTVAMLVENHYDELEEDLGSKEFLSAVPDRRQRINLSEKLSRLLGKLELDVKPAGDGTALIKGRWKPGKL